MGGMIVNIIDILILAILVFSLLAGMHKGFLTSLLASVGLLGAWAGAGALYPKVAQLALSNTSLMNALSQYLEPRSFFSSISTANMAVRDVVAGGEAAIQSAVRSIGDQFSVIAPAFEKNIRTQAFERLNITTLAEYLDQTIWQSVFNVLAFVLCFVALYIAALLVVNLLDHVIRFPVLRMFDWLLGGVFGVLRGVAIVVLLLNVVPAVMSVLSPDLIADLLAGSKLAATLRSIDLIGMAQKIAGLIG